MHIAFHQTEMDKIENMRTQRFSTLPYPQLLHLEWLVREGDCYWITENGDTEPIGYFITDADQVLMELYVTPLHQNSLLPIFNRLVQDQQLLAVLAQSFDGIIMKCCLTHNFNCEVIGHIFSGFIDTAPVEMNKYRKQVATMTDWDLLLAQTDGLYETEEELRYMLDHSCIHMYFLEDALVGCGYFIPIRPDRGWYDIGMWVSTPHRRKGVAGDIISDLKHLCLRSDLTPVAGCAADNQPSKKTLEKNGFRTVHDFLLFQINGGKEI